MSGPLHPKEVCREEPPRPAAGVRRPRPPPRRAHARLRPAPAAEHRARPFPALSYGTLYPALRDLLDHGLIAETTDPAGPTGRRPRVVYELTAAGKEHFSALVARTDASAYEDDGFDVRFAFFGRTERDVRLRILEGRRSRVEEDLERVRDAAARSRERLDAYTTASSATVRRPPSARSAGSASSSTPNGATPQIPAPSRRCRPRHPGRTGIRFTTTNPITTPGEVHPRRHRRRRQLRQLARPGRALLQGRRPGRPTVPGLMHVTFGDYHVRDVEFVAAFDVDDKKVGKDLSEAINASENNTIKIADVPTSASRCSAAHPRRPGQVLPDDDRRVRRRAGRRRRRAARRRRSTCSSPTCRWAPRGRQVLRPVRDRRRRRLRQRPARVHRLRPRVGQEVRGGRRADHR
jgi:DNA-binding PadR family transcriptional regulator